MHLSVQLTNGSGFDPCAWLGPDRETVAFTDSISLVKGALEAERGKLDAFHIADDACSTEGIAAGPSLGVGLDPIVLLSAMAQSTERVGLVATMSTSLNTPYTIARQFRSLDLMSGGRVGWNVLTSDRQRSSPYSRSGGFERNGSDACAREVLEAVQQMWDGWPENALKFGSGKEVLEDAKKNRPINYRNQLVASVGSMGVPPSPQGAPAIFTAMGCQEGFSFASEHADAVYANPFDLPSAKRHWKSLLQGMKAVRRHPDSMTMFSGVITSIASSEWEAMRRRKALSELGDMPDRIAHLSKLLGVTIDDLDPDERIPAGRLAVVGPKPCDRCSFRARELARRGLTVREIIVHGAFNYHPVASGTPDQVADVLQTWLQAGVGGGLNIMPDTGLSALTDFVDNVVPILQRRGLLRKEYSSSTLCGHLGLLD